MKNLTKLTTLLVVDDIEACLPEWQALGYAVSVRVPESGAAGFVILKGPNHSELMLQTRKSLADDLPAVARKKPSFLLYGDVAELSKARRQLGAAKVLVEERSTFYGATESWLELENGVILGLSEHG
ncbi:MAG: hypothetical protein M3020_22080 [Myxococcota bacterium]|nr:hypothetical protein [Myxococcota bacterium]